MPSSARLRTIVVACALLFLPALFPIAAHSADSKAARSTIIIPFTPLRDHGVPLITVRINDQFDGTFLVDTGAGACILSSNFAKKLGMKPTPAVIGGLLPYSLGSDDKQQNEAYAKSIQIGRLKLPHTHFLVISDDDLFKFAEQPVDGIIGGPILSNFAMFVDYPRQFIALVTPGSLSDRERANIHMADATVIPLLEYKASITLREPTTTGDGFDSPEDRMGDLPINGAPNFGVSYQFNFREYTFNTNVKMRQNGKSASTQVTIDTGAPTTSLPFAIKDQLNPQISSFDTASTMYNGSGTFGVAKLDDFAVSSLHIPGFQVEFPISRSTDIPPLLGEDILSYCTALFDFPAGKLYLKPVMPPIMQGQVKPDPSQVDVSRLENAALDVWLFPSDGIAGDDQYDHDDVSGALASQMAKLKGDPSDGPIYLKLGAIYHNDRQNSNSQGAFAKAAALLQQEDTAKPGDPTMVAELIEALALSGKLDDAEALARTECVKHPDQSQACISLGKVLEAKALNAITGTSFAPDVSEDDISQYADIVAMLKSTPLSAEGLSSVRSEEVEARSEFDKAVQLAPQSDSAYIARSSFLREISVGVDLPLREVRGDKVIPITDGYPSPYFTDKDEIGLISNDPEQIEHSMLADVNEALFNPSSHVDQRPSKFWKSLPNGTRRKIQADIDRLTTLAASSDPAVAARAETAIGETQYNALNDNKLAETTLTGVVAAHPDQGEAVSTLVEILSDDRRYDDLMSVLTAAAKVKPTAQIHLAIARTLIKQGKLEDAESEARAALKLKPDSYQCNIIVAALIMHKPDASSADLVEAKTCLDKAAVALGNHPDISDQSLVNTERAIFQCITGDVNGSVQTVLAVLNKDRTNTQARNVLAAILM